MKYILTLTRCCTHKCDFCAVDALYKPTVAGCAALADREQAAGRQLTPDQWCEVVGKIHDENSSAEFDLSGGDCLALPWVSDRLIPFILGLTKNPEQVAVTATAKSLVPWIEKAAKSSHAKPGAIHITYDGYRDYSFENILLVPRVRELGVDVHVECPLTTENSHVAGARKIFHALTEAGIREMLLMPYFPVGRGAARGRMEGFEPSGDQYREAISEFMTLAKEHSGGPRVKVQCALRRFMGPAGRATRCKMGDATWCVMPDGTLLTCPWAYGLGGKPLDEAFNAGNALRSGVEQWKSRGRSLRSALRRSYPGACMVRAFIDDSPGGARAAQHAMPQTGQ